MYDIFKDLRKKDDFLTESLALATATKWSWAP